MKPSRETIFNGLLTLLSQAAYPIAIKEASRNVRTWDQVDSSQQPALFLQERPQRNSQNNIGMNKWELPWYCWVYFRRDPSAAPSITINGILDAIDAAIQPTPGMKQTLASVNGGRPMVNNVRIDNVAFDEAIEDPDGGQCIVMVAGTAQLGS